MRLKSISYKEFGNGKQEWTLEELALGSINLIVGKNATGKTRALNVVGSLGRMLANELKPYWSADYDALFEHDGQELRYVLKFKDQQVFEERFWVDGEVKLDRGGQGEGRILSQEIEGGTMTRFQTPTNELAAVARRDSLQHPFLQPLHDWGESLRHFLFGSSLGKETFVILAQGANIPFDDKNVNAAAAFFHQSQKQFGDPFTKRLIEDMERLDYSLEDVLLQPPLSVRFVPPLPMLCLALREVGLAGFIDQPSMSQGMYRSLAVLIHLAYLKFAEKSACLLIDDVGEGLDFDRSQRFIELVRERARETGSQLVMSTNDRFVMNGAPLEEWTVLQRKGNRVVALNHDNSPELFEDFKFTGLSNSSFLELDYPSTVSAREAGIG